MGQERAGSTRSQKDIRWRGTCARDIEEACLHPQSCVEQYSREWKGQERLSGLLQPGARGTGLEGLLLHGLQGSLGRIDHLLDLLEGLR